ncbi:MAG: lysylphosphatidylglycerol synthase transmembrane domain-containing protein [Chloroflexota bacterium]
MVAIRVAIGLAISVVALWLALRSIDLDRTLAILGRAAPVGIAVVLMLVALDVALRALRWGRLIAPVRPVAWQRMLAYMLIGYLANNVLPARLGEFVRSHYLGDREGISRAAALGTVVVERVVDIACVVVIGAAALLAIHGSPSLVRGLIISAVIVVLLIGAIVVLLHGHRLPGAERAIAGIDHWPAVGRLVRSLRAGVRVVQRPSTLLAATGLTTVAWLASGFMFVAAAAAVDVPLPLIEAAILSSAIALATAIPAGPGYVGTFELAGVTVGGALGLTADQALAIVLLVHAAILSVTTVGGLIALAQVRQWRGR